MQDQSLHVKPLLDPPSARARWPAMRPAPSGSSTAMEAESSSSRAQRPKAARAELPMAGPMRPRNALVMRLPLAACRSADGYPKAARPVPKTPDVLQAGSGCVAANGDLPTITPPKWRCVWHETRPVLRKRWRQHKPAAVGPALPDREPDPPVRGRQFRCDGMTDRPRRTTPSASRLKSSPCWCERIAQWPPGSGANASPACKDDVAA